MNKGYAAGAIRQYQQVVNQTATVCDNPHRLVTLLLEGAVDRLALAKGHTAQGVIHEKDRHIRSVMAIVDGLRMNLNREAGGGIAENLDQLYDYMNRRLLEANLKNDLSMMDEVIALLNEIKSGWVAIGSEVNGTKAADSGTLNPSQ